MKKSFRDHFSAVSGSYPQGLFCHLASLASRHTCAWDCATGSGQAALPLTRFFSHVIATDASTQQISKAAQHPRVHYLVAAAEKSVFRPTSIDLITVAQALHWFDLPRFYSEVERVLRPGGVLAVWSYGRFQVAHERMQILLDHFHDKIVGPYWPPERTFVEEGYRSLPFPFAQLPSPAFALTAEWTLHHLSGYLRIPAHLVSHTTLYESPRRRSGLRPFPQMERHWGDPRNPQAISWPIALRMGIRP